MKLDEIHDYWKEPYDGQNSPKDYLEGKERSEFLLSLIDILKDKKILEIGCNVGRNLHHLSEAGFTNLTGIEISKNAVELSKIYYPELKILNSSIEDIIKTFKRNEFDLVFTMAVFEHIHPDSEWIFPEVARIAKKLITIEDEKNSTWRHFPRNYKSIFELLGLKQIKKVNNIKGLDESYFARIFIKNE